jgi:hypothetical protein
MVRKPNRGEWSAHACADQLKHIVAYDGESPFDGRAASDGSLD